MDEIVKPKRKSNFPFIRIDANLRAIVGDYESDTIQSCQLLKKMWDYVKANDLKVK